MVTPTKLKASKEQFRQAIAPTVYTSTTLGKDWTIREWLHCDELSIVAAPGVDEARLSRHYGPIIQPDATVATLEEPLEIVGQYVKVVLEGAGADGDDVTWYGVIEVDDTTPFGSGPAGDKPRGIQRFVAYGLLRTLERVHCLKSKVDWSQNSDMPIKSVTLEHGLPINQHDRRLATHEGNRTTDPVTGNPFLGFWHCQSATSESAWTADDAVRYLLDLLPPVDGNGEPICAWSLAGDPGDERLNWHTPILATHGKTLKALLDELIPYRRGLSYRVEFDETEGDRGTATIVPFTFARDEVLFATDFRRLPANDDQVALDFDNALDVQARIVNSITSAYDEVIAIGAFATSTCTLSFGKIEQDRGGKFQIVTDWTDAQQTAYINGASGTAGYSALGLAAKYEANTRFRQRDDLRPAFRRFKVYDWWDGLVWDYAKAEAAATKYSFNPPWPAATDSDGTVRDTDPLADPIQPWSASNPEPEFSAPRLHIEPVLPFLDVCDYTGDRLTTEAWKDDLPPSTEWQYLPPLLYAITDNTTVSAPKYDLLDRLAEQASIERQRRRWSAAVRVLSDRPAFEINVQGAPQHFLYPNGATTLAETEPYNNAGLESGLDYFQFRITMAIRLPWQVQHRVVVNDTVEPGRQWRVLRIPVEARLDYVVPDTVVRINNGAAEVSNGGFVRDDRIRLAEVAQAAAQWYQTERQTLFFQFRGIRELLKVGQLITDVGGKYTIEGVNTPVTRVRYDFRGQRTEVETTLAQVDFQ